MQTTLTSPPELLSASPAGPASPRPESAPTSSGPAALSLVTPAARATRPVPAVDDRIAADLRARVQAGAWSSDARLCYELRSWQQARDYAPAEAAAQLGVPHVTSDTFARLRQFVRLTGPGTHWPELVGLHVDAEVTKRVPTTATATVTSAQAAVVAPAPPPAQAETPAPAPAMSVAPLDNYELDRLGCRIEAEMTAKTSGRRTAETAEMIRAAAARAKATRTSPMRERAGCKMPGIGSLAHLLADLDVGEDAKPLARQQAQSKWYSRLRVYVPLLTVIDAIARSEVRQAPRAPASTAAVVVPVATHPTPTAVAAALASKPALLAAAAVASGTIKGRPVLQDDGRLLVTFETTCAVGPGHDLWDAARAAMNAPR